MDSYESTHDYDEYHFDLDEIGHDPYVLVSILTANGLLNICTPVTSSNARPGDLIFFQL